MAAVQITTYDQLCAASADWLNRQDLVDQIPAFITLSTAQFNRELRLRDMMVRADATSSNENVDLPDDWLEHYSLVVAPGSPPPTGGWGNPVLRYMSERESNELKQQLYGATGPVRGYTIIGSMIELVPAPADDVNLKMVYYARIPDLGPSNQSNWLLARSPDLYLYSTLMQAAPYLKDDDRLGTWVQVRQAIIDGMRLESEAAMRPRSGLVSRAKAF